MNDQIKDFVEQHREEFDHLEAPAFDMGRFKKMQTEPEQPTKVKTVKLFNRSRWIAAASIILIAGVVWTFYYPQKQVEETAFSGEIIAKIPHRPIGKEEKKEAKSITEQAVKTETEQPKTIKKLVQAEDGEANIYRELKDSSSASVRLLAILKIEKTNRMNNKTLDMLSKTLNQDGNTNVRLAALGVLQKYSADKYASSLLVNSLNKQDDPMVQLGLVSFLGKMKNVEIGDKLYALANNPETFAAVRDEAYSVLLNQDKL